ncbi:MAG: hypothetical protein ACRD28_06080 [Acidobacteriaceae bacterium]
MAWDESFTCNICGVVKLESNHWWMITLGNVFCFNQGQLSQQFTLAPWNDEESRNPDLYHVCGEGCAMKALERFMSSGTLVQETSQAATRNAN